ncbi:kinase-like domain-containing protein [Lenzites betulinus]|nr:kinase-like domain-containing protein [Lenzites betulinus]
MSSEEDPLISDPDEEYTFMEAPYPAVIYVRGQPHGQFPYYEEQWMFVNKKTACGFKPIQIGDHIGKGRWEIVRKLGFGHWSSVWLARSVDQPRPTYAAIKIVSCSMTYLQQEEANDEHTAWMQISAAYHQTPPGTPGRIHVLVLKDTDRFRESSVHGKHYCYASEICSYPVTMLASPDRIGGKFTLRVAKSIVRQTLLALDFLHTRAEVLHGDVRLDNLYVAYKGTTAQLEQFLMQNPPQTYPVQYCPRLWDGPIISPKSQPLPPVGLHPNLDNLHIVLGDYGGARPIARVRYSWLDHTNTRFKYQAPEQLLESTWSAPVDIWGVGCLLFECITGNPLFGPPTRTRNGSWEKVHIAHIADRLGPFPPAYLSRIILPKREEYFDRHGKVKYQTSSPHYSLRRALHVCLRPTPEDAEYNAIRAFMARCLAIDPTQRPTAAELLQDPFLAY